MTKASSAKPRRYLALWFPFLPSDRLWRVSGTSPAQHETPLVLIERVRNALRLAAVDRRARALGLVPGLTLADARARVPDLRVADMDPAADAALLACLADDCDRYTPLVALDAPDGLILDITGCSHLFGGEDRLHGDAVMRFAGLGITAQASIAGTPEAAHALARFDGRAIVPPGEEAGAVKSLPVTALGVAPEIVLALARAGLKTVGDLAARPSAPLAARFGDDLPVRLARTLGREDIGITPRRPLPACIVERRFAEPIGHEEDVLEALARLAAQAALTLEQRGEGGRCFEAGFFRVDGKVTHVTAETGRPVRDPKVLMRLFRERIEVLADPLDPGFGFDLIRLAIVVTEALTPPQVSLDGQEAESEETAALVDRLAARLGAGAVLRFAPVDTHIPERAVRAVAAGTAAAVGWAQPEPGTPARPLHLFDPPQPIETLAEVPDGPPLRFRWRRVQHEVARAEGPERIAPEWWRRDDDSPTRDYYRIEDAAGRRFWVFREGLYGRETARPRWFLHGVFA